MPLKVCAYSLPHTGKNDPHPPNAPSRVTHLFGSGTKSRCRRRSAERAEGLLRGGFSDGPMKPRVKGFSRIALSYWNWWWPGTGLNRRRRPFQGRALPLSYLASVQTLVATSCAETGAAGEYECGSTNSALKQPCQYSNSVDPRQTSAGIGIRVSLPSADLTLEGNYAHPLR